MIRTLYRRPMYDSPRFLYLRFRRPPGDLLVRHLVALIIDFETALLAFPNHHLALPRRIRASAARQLKPSSVMPDHPIVAHRSFVLQPEDAPQLLLRRPAAV